MQFPEPTKTLRGPDLCLGSLLFLTKAAPSPRFRANIFLDYDIRNGRIIIPDDINKTTTILNQMLEGKVDHELDDNLIIDNEDQDIDI